MYLILTQQGGATSSTGLFIRLIDELILSSANQSIVWADTDPLEASRQADCDLHRLSVC